MVRDVVRAITSDAVVGTAREHGRKGGEWLGESRWPCSQANCQRSSADKPLFGTRRSRPNFWSTVTAAGRGEIDVRDLPVAAATLQAVDLVAGFDQTARALVVGCALVVRPAFPRAHLRLIRRRAIRGQYIELVGRVTAEVQTA